MHFWICLFLISIICGIFSTQARPENLFTSDSSVLDTDAFLDNDSQWSSNELISSVPDLAMNPIAQDSTIANNDEDLSTDFLDSLFTTNPSDTLFLSSACNDQGSLTADFLQARDGASSCSNQQRPQAGLKLPNIYDGNFLPQGLGGNTPGDSDSSNEGSRSEEIFLERSYYGVDIPEAFRLREDLEICPQDIFLVFRTPVCENPVTGSIEEVNVGTGINIAPGFVWSHMINVIPYTPLCPLDEIWCCSIIEARPYTLEETSWMINPSALTEKQLRRLSRLDARTAYNAYFCYPMDLTKSRGVPVPRLHPI